MPTSATDTLNALQLQSTFIFRLAFQYHILYEYQVLRGTFPYMKIKQQNSLVLCVSLDGERNSHKQQLKQSVAWEPWLGTIHRLLVRKKQCSSIEAGMWCQSSGTIFQAHGEKLAATSKPPEASKTIHFHFHSILSINFKFISNYGKNILVSFFK